MEGKDNDKSSSLLSRNLVRDLLAWERIPLLLLFFGGLILLYSYTRIGWRYWQSLPIVAMALLIYFSSLTRKMMSVVVAIGLMISFILLTVLVADFPLLFLFIAIMISLCYFWLQRVRHQYQVPVGRSLFFKITLILALAIFVGLNIWNIISSRSLAKELDQARAEQCCLTIADLKKLGEYDKIDDYRNGGPLLLACGKLIETRIDKWMNQVDIDEIWHKGINDLPLGKKLNDKEYKRVAELLKSCADLTPIIDQALAQPQLRVALDFPKSEIKLFAINLPHLSVLTDLARFLTLRTYCLHHDGELEKAVQVIGQMIKIANILEKEPFLISYLVRIAIHAKACNATAHLLHDKDIIGNPELLRQLQKIFAPTCSHGYYNAAMAFKSEMTFGYGAVSTPKSVFIGRWLTNEYSEVPAFLFVIAPQGWLKDNVVHLLRQQREFVEVAAESEQRILQQLQIWKKPYSQSMWQPLSALLLPALGEVLQRELEQLTRARCIWIALALRIEQAKTGKLPEKLDFLTGENSKYLQDPFSGKCLHYQICSKGYVLYGVGSNQKDDHGQLTDKRDKNDIGLWLKR